MQLQPPVRVTRGARDPGTPEPHLPGGPDAVGARWGQRSPRAGSSSGDSRCSEAQQRRLKEGSRYATRARHSSPRLKIQHRSSALGTKSPGLGASDLADQSAPRVSSAASPGSGDRCRPAARVQGAHSVGGAGEFLCTHSSSRISGGAAASGLPGERGNLGSGSSVRAPRLADEGRAFVPGLAQGVSTSIISVNFAAPLESR